MSYWTNTSSTSSTSSTMNFDYYGRRYEAEPVKKVAKKKIVRKTKKELKPMPKEQLVFDPKDLVL